MAGRTRTTKKLAQRIDLNYFKRAYPIPRWRRILSIGAIGLCVAWLGWAGLTGKQSAFNAGPLAQGHTILTNNCSSCHDANDFLVVRRFGYGDALDGFPRVSRALLCFVTRSTPVRQRSQ